MPEDLWYFKAYLGMFPPENHARPYNESEIIKFNNFLYYQS